MSASPENTPAGASAKPGQLTPVDHSLATRLLLHRALWTRVVLAFDTGMSWRNDVHSGVSLEGKAIMGLLFENRDLATLLQWVA